MTLFRYEMQKILRFSVVWILAALCIFANVFLIISNDEGRDFFIQSSAITKQLGQRTNASYIEEVKQLEQTPNHQLFIQGLESMHNPFTNELHTNLSEHYARRVKESDLAVYFLDQKYQKLGIVIDGLRKNESYMDIYANLMTYESCYFLYEVLLRMLCAEGCIISVLTTLYLFGYEDMNHTRLFVNSTKTGRHLNTIKMMSGLCASLVIFLVIMSVTMSVYFSWWNYEGIWNAHVASCFNYVIDADMYVKPFIPYVDFTFSQYLFACIGMITALIGISSLAGSGIGLLVHNTYIAAIVMLLLFSAIVAGAYSSASHGFLGLYMIFQLLPCLQWTTLGTWFTDGGMNTIFPMQEIYIGMFGMIIHVLIFKLIAHREKRKDIL